jgi:hypothetical protein
MWQAFINWLLSLFGKKIAEKAVEQVVDQVFAGVIKDVADPRDQIFTGEK